MKQILIKFLDGRLAYCRPAAPRESGESEEQHLTRIGQQTITKCVRDGQPGWAGAVVVAHVEENVILSADRVFRDGWDWTTPDPVMDYDMPKCRKIAARLTGFQESDPRIVNARNIMELKALR